MTAHLAEAVRTDPGSLVPDLYRVVQRRVEVGDVVTLSLEPVERSPLPFRAGQFNMLTAFGVGEVAISVSSAPGAPGPIEHTIRDVGAVTHALCCCDTGVAVGARPDSLVASFIGVIDEVAVFNRPLQDDEVKGVYESQK